MRCPAAVSAFLMLVGVTVGCLGPELAGSPMVARRLVSRTVVVEGRLARDAAPTNYGASLSMVVEQLHAGDERVAVSGGIRIAVGGQRVADLIDGWTRHRRVRIPMTLRQAPRYDNPATVVDVARHELAGLVQERAARRGGRARVSLGGSDGRATGGGASDRGRLGGHPQSAVGWDRHGGAHRRPGGSSWRRSGARS